MTKSIFIVALLMTLVACGGKDGSNGANGINGKNGTNGTNATPCSVTQANGKATITCPDGTSSVVNSVNMVQLCPNYTTTYNNSYPEYAFCIDQKLYATFWNGSQAYTAQIVPGYYTSTSPQGCNFTVGNNCQVTN